MRLFDLITQHAAPLLVTLELPASAARVVSLPGPSDFVPEIVACPLRYVLSDDLAAACTELALAGGDRLSGCLDLIHLPATSFWIEWDETARVRALSGHAGVGPGASPTFATKVGALVTATPDGRRGTVRTFWQDQHGTPCLAPLETHLDLDCGWPVPDSLNALLSGGLARVSCEDDAALEELLACMRFRYDARWAAYYREARLSADAQEQLLRTSMASVARDTPLLVAFSLLLGARNMTQTRAVDCRRLNRRREQRNRRPLLEHLEVSCHLDAVPAQEPGSAIAAGRRASRLHHVRGHLVRRANQIFWRKTHIRGRAAFGQVHSRTVELSVGPTFKAGLRTPGV